MSDFNEKWIPRWKLEPQFPGCKFCTFADGGFRTGRRRYRWMAKDKETGRVVADRWAMVLTSKKGVDYFVVSTSPRHVSNEGAGCQSQNQGVEIVYEGV